MDSRLLGMGVGTGACARPPTSLVLPTGGAAPATQKVPSVFCYARDFLCGVKRCATLGIPPPFRRSLLACAKSQAGFCYAHTLCKEGLGDTHGILQSGLPHNSRIPAMPPTFLRNVWEREPPSDQRDGGGGRIPIVAQNPSPQSPRGLSLRPRREPIQALRKALRPRRRTWIR